MEHEHCLGEYDGLHNAIGVPVMRCNDLQNTCSTEALESLDIQAAHAELREVQRITELPPHGPRKTP